MSDRRRRREHDAPEQEERPLHLSDYLAVLRQRRFLFWFVFLAVFGGLSARALLGSV